MSVNSGMFSSARDDWETPDDLFTELNAEFGFTLDVCATKANAKCARFISPEQDALHMRWGRGEVCWMNPPYGRQIGWWMDKACGEAAVGRNCVVCLVPARTDTYWWHTYAMTGEIRFLRGRVRFKGAKSGAPFPSAVVIFDGRSGRQMAKPIKRRRQKPKPKPSAGGRSDPGRLRRGAVTK